MQSQKNVYSKMGGGLALVGQLLDGAYPLTDELKGYDYDVEGLNYAKMTNESWRAFGDRQPVLVTSEPGDDVLMKPVKKTVPHDNRSLRRDRSRGRY
jgi:hypothetical protein